MPVLHCSRSLCALPRLTPKYPVSEPCSSLMLSQQFRSEPVRPQLSTMSFLTYMVPPTHVTAHFRSPLIPSLRLCGKVVLVRSLFRPTSDIFCRLTFPTTLHHTHRQEAALSPPTGCCRTLTFVRLALFSVVPCTEYVSYAVEVLFSRSACGHRAITHLVPICCLVCYLLIRLLTVFDAFVRDLVLQLRGYSVCAMPSPAAARAEF